MQYRALACDYDGTIATEGRVPAPVLQALEELQRSGRALLLATGRTRDQLLDVFPGVRLFARVILENGAVIHRPDTGEDRALGSRPPEAFVSRLKDLGVTPLVQGDVIVATKQPYETTVDEVIRDLKLRLHVVFNKGSVMVLPAGMTKATGLDAALEEIQVPWQAAVGVGDAENDHAFLERCGRSVGVANALPSLKEQVDWVTRSPEGAGVVEVVRQLLADDFAAVAPRASGKLPKEMQS